MVCTYVLEQRPPFQWLIIPCCRSTGGHKPLHGPKEGEFLTFSCDYYLPLIPSTARSMSSKVSTSERTTKWACIHSPAARHRAAIRSRPPRLPPPTARTSPTRTRGARSSTQTRIRMVQRLEMQVEACLSRNLRPAGFRELYILLSVVTLMAAQDMVLHSSERAFQHLVECEHY